MKSRLLILVPFLIALGACSNTATLSASAPRQLGEIDRSAASNRESPSTESLQETLEKYEQIDKNMTLFEVETLLGRADETNQIDIPGASTTQVYVWYNSNGSTIKLQFQNNSLMSKSQVGLVSSRAEAPQRE